MTLLILVAIAVGYSHYSLHIIEQQAFHLMSTGGTLAFELNMNVVAYQAGGDKNPNSNINSYQES